MISHFVFIVFIFLHFCSDSYFLCSEKTSLVYIYIYICSDWMWRTDCLSWLKEWNRKINFTFRLKFVWEAKRQVWKSARWCRSYSSRWPVVYLWQSLQQVISNYNQMSLQVSWLVHEICHVYCLLTSCRHPYEHSECDLSGGCSFRERSRHDWWVSATMICFQSLWSMDTQCTDAEQRICT